MKSAAGFSGPVRTRESRGRRGGSDGCPAAGVILLSEGGGDAEMRFGRGERRDALVFAVDDRGLFTFDGLAVDDHTALVDVENPVVGDPGAGVQVSLYCEIEG